MKEVSCVGYVMIKYLRKAVQSVGMFFVGNALLSPLNSTHSALFVEPNAFLDKSFSLSTFDFNFFYILSIQTKKK